MTRNLILAAFCLVILAPARADDLVPVTYVCERGVEVPVVFVNAGNGESRAVALIDGRLLGMRQVISASGARYRSGNGADSYQLWIKGKEAFISFGPDGDDTVLFQKCLAQR